MNAKASNILQVVAHSDDALRLCDVQSSVQLSRDANNPCLSGSHRRLEGRSVRLGGRDSEGGGLARTFDSSSSS